MSFTPDQRAALHAKLDGSHVKTRKQGGSNVSYIEGWQTIAEANRIFGFDGWTRETLSAECVYSGEYQKAVWENGRKTDKTTTMFRCTYNARLRVTAGGVFRDGTGSGHGFGENPGDAHESAIKEAETDAMKRALMTFGNPFGLALYDKAQSDVDRSGNGNAAAPAANGHAVNDKAASNGTAAKPAARTRDDAFFKRDSYEIKPTPADGWPAWEKWFRAAAEDCKTYAEWTKLEDDNLGHRNKYTAKAPPEVCNNLLAFVREIDGRLNPAFKP